MLLAVDVGNTQTVIGLFDKDVLGRHWRIATDKTSTSDELRVKLSNLLGFAGLGEDDVAGIALASVVPGLTDAWTGLARQIGHDPVVVSAALDLGLPIHYAQPSEIGADRLADAVACIARHGAPAIVVDLGTATNFEVIDEQGAFLGGVIAPGFMTSANALFDAAERLSRMEVETPEHVIGTSTRMAIQSGLVYGEVSRIDGLVRRIESELGYKATVVATGGLANRIAPLSDTIDAVDEDLTLWGLHHVYHRVRGC